MLYQNSLISQDLFELLSFIFLFVAAFLLITTLQLVKKKKGSKYGSYRLKGQAEVVRSSLLVRPPVTNFSLTIRNTGTMSITRAECKVEKDQWRSFPSWVYINLLPGRAADARWILGMQYEVGKAYSVTIKLTYIDGSTSTIKTSVVAES
jgi:hypothetical protein